MSYGLPRSGCCRYKAPISVSRSRFELEVVLDGNHDTLTGTQPSSNEKNATQSRAQYTGANGSTQELAYEQLEDVSSLLPNYCSSERALCGDVIVSSPRRWSLSTDVKRQTDLGSQLFLPLVPHLQLRYPSRITDLLLLLSLLARCCPRRMRFNYESHASTLVIAFATGLTTLVRIASPYTCSSRPVWSSRTGAKRSYFFIIISPDSRALRHFTDIAPSRRIHPPSSSNPDVQHIAEIDIKIHIISTGIILPRKVFLTTCQKPNADLLYVALCIACRRSHQP